MTKAQLAEIRARLDGGYELSRLDTALLLDEVERLTHNIVQIERHAAIVDTTVKTLSSRFNTVCDIISKNGCDCVCDCDCEGHVSEDCEPCLACRVSTTLWPNGSADE